MIANHKLAKAAMASVQRVCMVALMIEVRRPRKNRIDAVASIGAASHIGCHKELLLPHVDLHFSPLRICLGEVEFARLPFVRSRVVQEEAWEALIPR